MIPPWTSPIATRLPEELFEHILWYACDFGGALPLHRQTKATIALLGQVCRYWARLSRRRLFCALVLRTSTESLQFQAFITSRAIRGLEPISDLILSLQAIVDSEDRPWLHLAAFAVAYKLRRCEYFTVTVARPSTIPQKESWRTLYPALPRSLPGSFVQIFKLTLDSIRFPNGHALFRLLASIPSLCNLTLVNLTWSSHPTADDFFAAPFGWRLSEVVSDDGLALYFLPLLVASIGCGYPAVKGHRERSPRYLLDLSDHQVLLDLISAFEGSSSAENCAEPITDCGRTIARIKDSLYDDIETQSYLQIYGTKHGSGERFGPELYVHITPSGTRVPTVLHVDKVYVDLVQQSFDNNLNETAWELFASTALQLPYLQYLELLRPCRTEHDDALGISDSAFQPLIGAQKLRSRWLQDSRRTSAMRADGTERVDKRERALRASDNELL